MKKLTLSRLERVDHLVSPHEFSDLTEQSSALSVVKDFRVHQPHTVRVDASAIEVARLMSMEGVDAKLVADKRAELVGLLTRERLTDQRLLVTQVALGVARQALSAADMMLPRASLPVLDYEALRRATLGDLVTTLREAGEAYCLVLDRDQHHIRGLISAWDIGERLHQSLTVQPKTSIAQAILS